MTLLRALARPMLASYFVLSGVKALRDPESLVPAAEPLTEKMVPLVKKAVPDDFSDFIPEDTATLVRINGGLQLVGGLALATGKGRRLGAGMLAASLVPATLAKHPFWQRTDPEEKAADKNHFLKNVALLGGVLIASADTEGKPSLAWRAQSGTEALGKNSRKATARAKKKAVKTGRSTADAAITEGSRVLDTVVRESRRAKKRTEREIKRAGSTAERQAKTVKREAKQASQAAKQQAKLIGKNIELGTN